MSITQENWHLRTRLYKEKHEAVLTHLTDAAHRLAPCPDNGSVWYDYTELASSFRAKHGRWPLWWEMAKVIQEFEGK